MSTIIRNNLAASNNNISLPVVDRRRSESIYRVPARINDENRSSNIPVNGTAHIEVEGASEMPAIRNASAPSQTLSNSKED